MHEGSALVRDRLWHGALRLLIVARDAQDALRYNKIDDVGAADPHAFLIEDVVADCRAGAAHRGAWLLRGHEGNFEG